MMKTIQSMMIGSQSGSKNKELKCKTHGAYTSLLMNRGEYGPGWTECPRCTQEQREEEGRQDSLRIVRERKQLILKNLKAIHLPEKYIDAKFDDLTVASKEHARNIDICRRFARNFDRALAAGSCLVLYGNPGTGKTHLAFSIANEIIERDYAVASVDADSLLEEIKMNCNYKNDSTEHDKILEYSDPDLLIIDELNASILKDPKNLDRIFSLVNRRYNKVKCTILISNAAFRKGEISLNALMCERTRDRIIDNGGIMMPFSHTSWRRNKSQPTFMID